MNRRRVVAAVVVLLALVGCGSAGKASKEPLVGVSSSPSPSGSPSPSLSDVAATPAASVPAGGVPTPNRTTGAAKPPTTKPAPPKTTAPAGGAANVHPGAFCSPEGAIGHTSTGTLMRCTRKAGEDRPRWRAP
jgi:hypothetical protein